MRPPARDTKSTQYEPVAVEAAWRVGRRLVVDLADGRTESSAVRRGPHLEPASLQHPERS